LQRAIGNAAVGRLLQRQTSPRAALTAQARRTLGSAPGPLARAASAGTETTVAQPAEQGSAAVQREAAPDGQAEGDDLARRIQAASRGGQPLDGGVQRHLEAGLGASLSGVRVHSGGEADGLSRAVQAVAFTTGSNIFFRAGTYNPSTPQGLHLLAHEASHTVQQAQGPVAGTPHPGGVSISDPSDRFESAAEAAAARVASAPGLPLQRHAEDGEAHVGTPGSQHTVQPTVEPHVCGPHCRHAAPLQRTAVAPSGATPQLHVCGPHCRHAASSRPLLMRRVARMPVRPRPALQRATGVPVVVQRHSSFEHKMLGDVSPDDLQVLASAKNLDKTGAAMDESGNAIVGPNGVGIMKKDVIHVLEQEIRRLNYFKNNASVKPGVTMNTRQVLQDYLRDEDTRARTDELKASIAKDQTLTDDTARQAALRQGKKAIEDTKWQVRIVELPSSDPNADSLLVTYGEMNTLADLYGSPKELIEADPVNRWQVVQGIRQQSIIKFLDLLREVKGANYLKRKFGMHLGEGFDDAIGNTGRGNGPLPLGELRLMGTFSPLATGKKTGDADPSQSYKGGLARNACHFAPESWHAWANYHRQARKLAREAYKLRNPGRGNVPSQWDLAQADAFENDALIANGFGDHFLQDSYAAGHLINKTQVMKWFVKWLDAHPFQSDKEIASEWRRIQPMAYSQPGLGVEATRYDASQVGTIAAKDPQSVENMPDPNAAGGGAAQGRKDRFAALGLKVPPSLTPTAPAFKLLVDWQHAAAGNSKYRTMTVDEAVDDHHLALSYTAAAVAFKDLVEDDVALVAGKGIKRQDLTLPKWNNLNHVRAKSFVLRNEYVPKNAAAFANLRANLWSATAATRARAERRYANKALNTTYAQYHKFLNNTLLQGSTNDLHDHFCKNGIEVETASGVSLGRIYGDDAMLGRDSAKGVQYSGETAQMSRQAIFDLIELGPKHPVPAITAISQRFPNRAKLDSGQYGSMTQWHQDLEKLCNDTIFPNIKGKVTGNLKNLAATFQSNVSPKVSKDVHPGADVF
jgi:hypothetical protein